MANMDQQVNDEDSISISIEMFEESLSDPWTDNAVEHETQTVTEAPAISIFVENEPDPDSGIEYANHVTISRGDPINDVELISIINALGGEVDDPEQFILAQMQLIQSIANDAAIVEAANNISFQPSRTCEVCFEMVPLHLRPCCRLPVCDQCIESYVDMQLLCNGVLRIECPNPTCKMPFYHDDIRLVLANKPEVRDRYDRWIVDLNGDPRRKTCPRCCHVTELEDGTVQRTSVSMSSLTAQPSAAPSDRKSQSSSSKTGLKIRCVECQLDWCFTCQAPWHEGISCKQYQTGDVLLKNWARERPRPGERNAQRCPNCKVCIS